MAKLRILILTAVFAGMAINLLPAADNAITRLVQKVEIGQPYSYGGLTLYPLMLRSSQWNSGIRTLDEALQHQWITILEKGNAQVSTLRVRNNSQHYIFLTAGEVITGGKQNRIIRNDTLLPPRSQLIDLPVYCSEKNRWRGKGDCFASPRSLSHQELRVKAAKGASQESIWREIDKESARAKVSSPTRDYQKIYEDERVQRKLDDYALHLKRCCRPNTVGVVAVTSHRIIGADIFSDPTLLAKLWDKICHSYAMDPAVSAAVAVPKQRRPIGLGQHEVRQFLSRVLSSTFTDQYTPGCGQLLRISGSVEGAGLIFRDHVVHVGLFSSNIVKPLPMEPQPYRSPRIERR